jgi:inorganic pyrophosphatase
MLQEIEEFFRVYKNLEGKEVVIRGFESQDLAVHLIETAIHDYKKKFLAD